MDDKWSILYRNSGWNINKLYGEGTAYPEPFHSLLKAMVTASVNNKLPITIARVDTAKQLHFYLIGKDEQEAEEFFSSAKAYLGSCYTTCHPMTFLSSDDGFEQQILTLFPQGFKRISIQKACSSQRNKDDTYWVMESLNLAVQQYHNRPISMSNIKRPIGVILRHFFIAVQNSQGERAFQLLLELKNHQRLSPRNLLSLEIQALAADHKWRAILQHPKLDDLIKGTIPRRLQNVLLKCVGFDKNNSTRPSDYVPEKLTEQLESLFPLFSSLPDLEHDEISIEEWKLWAIGAVSFGRTAAIDQLPSCIDSKWLDDLRTCSGLQLQNPDSSNTPEIKIVTPSIEDHLISEPTEALAVTLLQAALAANDKEKQQIYLRLCDYPKDIIKALTDNSLISQLWEILKANCDQQIKIDSWHQLFHKLSGTCNLEEANTALTYAIDRSDYWLADSWQESKVISDIENISDEITQTTLRGILPILVNWLTKHKLNLPSAAIEHLMMLLVSDDQIAGEDLILSSNLLQLLLDQGHTKGQYNSILDCIDECWDTIKSPTSVDNLLEIYDVLIDYPCADENRRMQSWLSTQPYLVSSWDRLDNQQQQLSHEFARFIIPDTVTLPTIKTPHLNNEDEFLTDLSGKILAIYTLTEGAGRRAKNILMTYFPGLDVKLNHDKSATDKLMNLATTADYFIFSSRSAAHQAFYPVSNKRKDLIYPKGKGASSIVREFLNHLDS